MRTFYEEWSYLDKSEPALLESDKDNLAPVGAKLEISNWRFQIGTSWCQSKLSFRMLHFSP